jgi:hypothetical protein
MVVRTVPAPPVAGMMPLRARKGHHRAGADLFMERFTTRVSLVRTAKRRRSHRFDSSTPRSSADGGFRFLSAHLKADVAKLAAEKVDLI